MKKEILLFGIFVLAVFSSYGQVAESENDIEQCSINDAEDRLRQEHPELADQIRMSEEQLKAFTEQFEEINQNRDDEYIIPVVFHIVHANGDENISDEQVEDAIRAMNADFSGTTDDVGDVHEAFADIVANAGIEFRLAQRDPEGNCTNGIIRTYSSTTFEGGENLKNASPIWDRSRYLNIWTCQNIESGAAGYSNYPASMDNNYGDFSDGIVVRSDYVGIIGTSIPSHEHTLSHEVGHYLNLPHLWGSSNEPGMESNCNMDDGVEDTPNTIGWTSCNINGESCGSLDNVENFMEYSYCGKMFTLGQASRMIAVLNFIVLDRNNLWVADNLLLTGVTLEPEICEADFESDRRIVCVGEEISFEDRSFNGVVERSWTFEGADVDTSSAQNPTVIYNTPGYFDVAITVGDGENTETEIKEDFIVVLDTAYQTVPYSEDFEEVADLSVYENWYAVANDDEVEWELNTEVGYSGNNSAYVQGRYNTEEDVEQLVSKTFHLSDLDENASLSFRYAYGKRTSNHSDELNIYISRNCGDHWVWRQTIEGDELPTVEGNFFQEYVPSDDSEWREVFINTITPIFWTDEFRIKFEFRSGNFGNNIYIDDINVVDNPALSVEDNLDSEIKELKIYPNPASESVTITYNNLQAGNTSISLTDLTGRNVKEIHSGTMQVGEFRGIVDVADLSPGFYLIEFRKGTGRETRKLIIE